jgi:hypothetical protein
MFNPSKKPGVINDSDITKLETRNITKRDFKIGKLLSLLKDANDSLRFQGIIAELCGLGFDNRAKVSLKEITIFVDKFPEYKNLEPEISPFIKSIKSSSKRDIYEIVMDRLCKVLYGKDYLNGEAESQPKDHFETPERKKVLDPDDARIIPPEVIKKGQWSASNQLNKL